MTPADIVKHRAQRVAAGADLRVDFKHQRAGVYLIYCRENQRGYIGSTVNAYDRFQQHRAELDKGRHCNRHLQRSWVKYGASAFDLLLIEECSPESTTQYLVDRENAWLLPATKIDRLCVFNAELPAVVGRNPGFTFTVSEATRAKLRAAKLGKPGLIPGPETRRKMADASRGRRHTPEARLKNALASARHMTPEKVREVRTLLTTKQHTQRAIAHMMGIPEVIVSNIKLGRSWRLIT